MFKKIYVLAYAVFSPESTSNAGLTTAQQGKGIAFGRGIGLKTGLSRIRVDNRAMGVLA
jgi:hypothetical protein